jgi:hydrogenase-4 membrane subunit HyfE
VSAALSAIDALFAVLVGLAALGLVISRQMAALLRLFVWQSILLAASATTLAVGLPSGHLYFFAAVTVASKVIAIPLVLRSTLSREIYARREIDQVVSIPMSLLAAAALAIVGWAMVRPLVVALGGSLLVLHVSLGVVVLLLGAFTIVVRREAVAQLLGLLVMENGAFLAGVALVPDMTSIVEVAIAIDVPIVALVIGLLIRTIHNEVGTTSVGGLSELKDG